MDFGRLALGHADQSRAQQPAVEEVARLHHLHDGAGRLAGVGDLEHRLVEVVVELLAQGLDLLEAVALEGGEQIAFGRLDADGQRVQHLVLLARVGGDVVECAAEIVGRPIALLLPPGHENEEDEILKRIRGGERLEHFETKRRRTASTAAKAATKAAPAAAATATAGRSSLQALLRVLVSS